jgi:hypothetical protein
MFRGYDGWFTIMKGNPVDRIAPTSSRNSNNSNNNSMSMSHWPSTTNHVGTNGMVDWSVLPRAIQSLCPRVSESARRSFRWLILASLTRYFGAEISDQFGSQRRDSLVMAASRDLMKSIDSNNESELQHATATLLLHIYLDEANQYRNDSSFSEGVLQILDSLLDLGAHGEAHFRFICMVPLFLSSSPFFHHLFVALPTCLTPVPLSLSPCLAYYPWDLQQRRTIRNFVRQVVHMYFHSSDRTMLIN